MNGEIDPVSNIQIMFNKDVLFTGNWTASFTCYDETMAIPSDVPEINDNILSFAIDLPSYVFCSLSIEEGSILILGIPYIRVYLYYISYYILH